MKQPKCVRNLSLNEFCVKLAGELSTVGVMFGYKKKIWRLKTCSLDTCNRQFWSATTSNRRFPTCTQEHGEALTRQLNAARQKRFQQSRKRRRA